MYLYKFDKTTQMCSKTLLNRVKFNWFKKKTYFVLSAMSDHECTRQNEDRTKVKHD